MSSSSGSTVPYVVDRIVQKGAELNKERVFVPTGFQSKQLIVEANLTLGDVDQYLSIDVTIDGADESVASTPSLYLAYTLVLACVGLTLS